MDDLAPCVFRSLRRNQPSPPCSDYRAIPALDRYGREGLDDGFDDDMSEGARMRARLEAEAAMDFRDAREGRRRRTRLPGALDGEWQPTRSTRPSQTPCQAPALLSPQRSTPWSP